MDFFVLSSPFKKKKNRQFNSRKIFSTLTFHNPKLIVLKEYKHSLSILNRTFLQFKCVLMIQINIILDLST